MLRFVNEPLGDGEVAVLYSQGGDTLILLNPRADPQERCDAVNRLLARLAARRHITAA